MPPSAAGSPTRPAQPMNTCSTKASAESQMAIVRGRSQRRGRNSSPSQRRPPHHLRGSGPCAFQVSSTERPLTPRAARVWARHVGIRLDEGRPVGGGVRNIPAAFAESVQQPSKRLLEPVAFVQDVSVARHVDDECLALLHELVPGAHREYSGALRLLGAGIGPAGRRVGRGRLGCAVAGRTVEFVLPPARSFLHHSLTPPGDPGRSKRTDPVATGCRACRSLPIMMHVQDKAPKRVHLGRFDVHFEGR